MQNNIRISEYSFKEELLNIATHGIGVLLSVLGLVVLYNQAIAHGTQMHLISYVIFGITLIALYLASTLYHSFANTRFNSLFKKIDHLSIYFLIAGTYSPFMLVSLKNGNGFLMIKIIWALVLISCIFKFSKYKILRNIAFANYLLMGWIVLFVLEELTDVIPVSSLYLLVAGGISYTVGVIFYLWDKYHIIILFGICLF